MGVVNLSLLSVAVCTRASVFFIAVRWMFCIWLAIHPGSGRLATISARPTMALKICQTLRDVVDMNKSTYLHPNNA